MGKPLDIQISSIAVLYCLTLPPFLLVIVMMVIDYPSSDEMLTRSIVSGAFFLGNQIPRILSFDNIRTQCSTWTLLLLIEIAARVITINVLANRNKPPTTQEDHGQILWDVLMMGHGPTVINFLAIILAPYFYVTLQFCETDDGSYS